MVHTWTMIPLCSSLDFSHLVAGRGPVVCKGHRIAVHEMMIPLRKDVRLGRSRSRRSVNNL
jgi:hypothetical protein